MTKNHKSFSPISTRDRQLYMDMAIRSASQSYAERLQVGAVFVSTAGIITLGYNGTLPGHDNCCEYRVYSEDAGGWLDPDEIKESWPYEETQQDGIIRRYALKTKPEVIHAELNALMKMLRQGISAVGATGFLTHSPCIECSKTIVLAGVTTIFYDTLFRSTEGITFLESAGVTVLQHK